MSDITSTDGTTTTDGTTSPDSGGFTPNYTPTDGVRIHRARLYADEGGVATVTFRGQIDDATTDLWVEQGGSGRPSLYAEVVTDDDTATEVRLAIVPTGKRVPSIDSVGGDRAKRLGTVQRGSRVSHVYLLTIDGSADRAAYEAEQAQRRADRAAARAAREQASGFALLVLGGPDDDDTDGDA